MEIVVELCAVIVAVRDGRPWVLTVERDGLPALPSGDLDPGRDRTLDRAMRRWSAEQTGLALGFVEQLYTFGDVDRDAVAATRDERRLSVAYLAFVGGGEPVLSSDHGATWLDVYALLPWEDRRGGEPSVLTDQIRPAIATWIEAAASDVDEADARAERAEVAWGRRAGRWDAVRSLERYEMLYELALVGESQGESHRLTNGVEIDERFGPIAALDHRRVLASALGRVRGKLTYRPVVFELLPPTFTLSQLQRVVEALVGVLLHKQNFRRLVEGAGLVEGTGQRAADTGGRPAELFRFRREVLRERPTPGLGITLRR